MPEEESISWARQFSRLISDIYTYAEFCQRMGDREPIFRSSTSQSKLEEIRNQTKHCQKCRLGKTRTQSVFGEGNPRSQLVLVGEAPGYEEDQQGRPFVGKAGQLLTRIIAAIDLTREEVYITNVVKCRPPQNRNPLPDEIAACEPYLHAQLEIIQPRVICALGNFAAQTLLKTKNTISRLRGRCYNYGNITVVPTFHPAACLRFPQYKKMVWEDIQLVKETLKDVSRE